MIREKLSYIQQFGEACRTDLWGDFANFPVFFPVSREFGPETGSQQTPSTASKSSLSSDLRYECELVVPFRLNSPEFNLERDERKFSPTISPRQTA
jgi:hypothetical protein